MESFNSLSRDHLRLKAARVDAMIKVNFQLPLSGSRQDGLKFMRWDVIEKLSTPSLGITTLALAPNLFFAPPAFNSLSRDHSTTISAKSI